MDLPTVRVKHPELEGGVLINATDFDPAVHERFDGAVPFKFSRGDNVFIEGGEIRNVWSNLEGTDLPPADSVSNDPADVENMRQAHRTALLGRSFVELKEMVADLGVVIVPVGTTKAALVDQIIELQHASIKAQGARR